MDVLGINAAAGTSLLSSRTDQNSMDIDDFYAILAAQLQNQTMYDSVDNTEYIGQMVQFSLLSQMQQMGESLDKSYAFSLLGKNVDISAKDTSGGSFLVSGTVQKAATEDGVSYVYVNGNYYEVGDVVQVGGSGVASVTAASASPQTAAASGGTAARTQSDAASRAAAESTTESAAESVTGSTAESTAAAGSATEVSSEPDWLSGENLSVPDWLSY